ncbi:MAG: YbjN domain-containing protein [Spirochaetaceae bacterium]|jgi:hypothetical protein|nr:YbjN domain-containing protein [Spirochaetaceae bacterium]
MTDNKIEQYLRELKVSYRELEPNLWLVEPEGQPQVAVLYAEPLVVIRALVMEAPRENRLELFTKLLALNAADMIHGAYGLEGDKIVLIDSWEYGTLDFEELRATIESFSLALTQHYPLLSVYRDR